MISVVIPSYNGAETLFQAIDSVLCQTTKTPLEILVIDDNSTDDTLEKMGRYGENDRVRYIRNETNKGASASRNRGVQLAKGDYIAFLDADDYWDPEKLEKKKLVQKRKKKHQKTMRQRKKRIKKMTKRMIRKEQRYRKKN